MTETPEEVAFWKAIGANPADSLPRKVFADWLEENAKPDRECKQCHPAHPGCVWTGKDGMKWIVCPHCRRGVIADGRADLAAALRVTADRVPLLHPHARWSWALRVESVERPHSVHLLIWKKLTGAIPPDYPSWHDYPTAADAIRDLCRAWIAVRRTSEVPT